MGTFSGIDERIRMFSWIEVTLGRSRGSPLHLPNGIRKRNLIAVRITMQLIQNLALETRHAFDALWLAKVPRYECRVDHARIQYRITQSIEIVLALLYDTFRSIRDARTTLERRDNGIAMMPQLRMRRIAPMLSAGPRMEWETRDGETGIFVVMTIQSTVIRGLAVELFARAKELQVLPNNGGGLGKQELGQKLEQFDVATVILVGQYPFRNAHDADALIGPVLQVGHVLFQDEYMKTGSVLVTKAFATKEIVLGLNIFDVGASKGGAVDDGFAGIELIEFVPFQ